MLHHTAEQHRLDRLGNAQGATMRDALAYLEMMAGLALMHVHAVHKWLGVWMCTLQMAGPPVQMHAQCCRCSHHLHKTLPSAVQ
jgi:hypothetical protein